MSVTGYRRRIMTVLAAVVALGGAACGGDNEKAEPKATTTVPASTTTVPAPTNIAPLTGAAGDQSKLGRPALVVKIDNAPKGRPQAGLNEADIVYEEGVEGGITRLAVIFHSQELAEIGPIRSARTTDIFIAAPLNRPLFAWSGANRDFVQKVRAAPMVDVGVDVKPAPYFRKSGRPSLYNLFARFGQLYEGVDGGPPPAIFSYRAAGEAAAGSPATKAHMEWKDKVQTIVDWEWDAGAGAWVRTQNGTPHVDAGGARVSAKNVVIQLVTYHDTGYRDQSGTIVPEADMVGEGETMVLTDGKVIRGRWKRDAQETPTVYTDEAGQPIKLTPGNTWVELPKPGMATVS